MRLSQLVGRRIKETPKDATLASHQFLLRGGCARQVASGIYSLLPLGTRIIRKIEALIREEMNAIDGEEVILPVVMPREMWEESGRYATIGKEMARFQDRHGKDMLLGMTHEEAVVTLAKTEATSYKHFPFMMYQIQTKFRDEPRPRGGLVRVREFTMKDAYSFHTTQKDLEAYYDRCYKAYERIFRRVGLKNSVVVKSDTGMMGGTEAHEFMLVTDGGEDTLILCKSCGYAANNEVAVMGLPPLAPRAEESLTKVATPGVATIEALCGFLKIKPEDTAKAVFYKYEIKAAPGAAAVAHVVFALTRGDREINEVKLAKAVKNGPLVMAHDGDIRGIGAVPGFASPLGLKKAAPVTVVVDESVFSRANLVTGANEVDQHWRGFSPERDLRDVPHIRADIGNVNAGDLCSKCGNVLTVTRGIEIGNIFQLGSKYTESMGMRYQDQSGKPQTPLMGCYGIGVGRLLAAAIEDSHDQYGPIWPISIAPFHVHINTLQMTNEPVRAAAEKIYRELTARGIEVLWDDTDNKPGFQFADADLLGVPIRLVVSPKNLEAGVVEYKTRDGQQKGQWPLPDVVRETEQMYRGLRETLQ